MATKTEIAQRESIREILQRLNVPHVLPLTVSFSEIAISAASRGVQIHPPTIGLAAESVISALESRGVLVERRRPPNASFVVVRDER